MKVTVTNLVVGLMGDGSNMVLSVDWGISHLPAVEGEDDDNDRVEDLSQPLMTDVGTPATWRVEEGNGAIWNKKHVMWHFVSLLFSNNQFLDRLVMLEQCTVAKREARHL